MNMIFKEKMVKEVKDYLCELLNLESDQVSASDHIIEDLGANSFVIAEIFLFLQERYETSLEQTFMLGKPMSINDIADKVMTAMAERK